jgi:ABC-type transport system involved in multi-copper enzyme maturation permease subunit
MSAQTGSMPPSGPASSRLVDRARFRVDRLKNEPNPIWIRELKQATRLVRTPVILLVACVLMTLLIASIGGLVSADQSPATTGVVLFQVFFSLAYFVVTVVGPAVAANSIASEREGRTWEAVILTGLSPGSIARGKFLAAFTAIGMYVVMLAPVGALPFLFGGVTAMETVVAFAFLFLIALLSVAFGLAISSKMASLRAAIFVTLLLIFPISIIAFLTFGLGLSYAAHHAWPGVPEALPIWLPTAYERASFGVDYVVFLLVLPVTAVALPAWFLYEVTIANLTSMTDDRSTGLKRWFLVAAPVLTIAAVVPVLTASPSDRMFAAIAGLCALLVFFSFCVFLFQGDPIGPSRRVTAAWDEARAGAFRRFLGPGVTRSGVLMLAGGVGGLVVVGGVGAVAMRGLPREDQLSVLVMIGYAVGFYVFLVGLGAFLRSRTSTAMVSRVVLFMILFAIAGGPWIFAVIADLIADNTTHEALIIAAPSPFYVFMMIDALQRARGEALLVAGLIAIVFWAILGLVFLSLARARCARIIAQHEVMLAETERILAAEDAAEARAAAGIPEEAPPAPTTPEATAELAPPEAPAGATS